MSIESGEIDEIKVSGNEKKKAFFMSIVNAKAADQLFHHMEITEEDVVFANSYYKLSEDPSVTNLMQNNFLRMQTAKMNKSR